MIELTILELILWAAGLSALSFTLGMLFILCLSLKEQRRIDGLIPIPELKHCQKCGAKRRGADDKWQARCHNPE